MSEHQVDVLIQADLRPFVEAVRRVQEAAERAGFALAEWQRRYLEAVMGYGEPGHLSVPEVVCENGRHGDIGDGEPQAVEAWYRCPHCRAEV